MECAADLVVLKAEKLSKSYRMGMVEVHALDAVDLVLQVPVSSLFRKDSEWNVFVVDNGKAVVRAVKIGHRNQKEAEVLGRLSKGETVVLYPDDRLAQGTAVTR